MDKEMIKEMAESVNDVVANTAKPLNEQIARLKAKNKELRQGIINDRDDVVLVPKKIYDQFEKLKAENERLREALLNMCFCKRHLCEQCGYVKEMPERCVNEIIRDEVFRKLSKL